ncbi:unnamed protein product [Candidula unifasciata]|uniref:Uncharacterized protein n=1 Tax=Candidula unifasciata TaxID=100452 RepID=A0A8S3ZQN8_9EUPU|nr:unnamed protein product [Candidula unifasciata]
MAAVWCLLLVAVGCAAAPERSEGNVFPPYKPLFSPEEWKEILQLLNITKRDNPPLYDDPLTHEQIIELIKQPSTLYRHLDGQREHAQPVNREHPHQQLLLDPSLPEDILLELELALDYDEILAILGEYLKG